MRLRWFGTIRKTLSFNNRYFVIMSTLTNNKGFSHLVVLGLLLISVIKVYAQTDEHRQREFNLNDDNVALQGYDAVSYFMGATQKGNKEIAQRQKSC